MSVKRLVIDGYGQVELNNVAFRRDGRIEAQCALDATDFADMPAENGMLLAVDKAAKVVRLPVASEECPIALHYSSEHIYDERTPGLKNFKLEKNSFYPRMGYLAVGDLFTTNAISYDTEDFANEDALIEALEAYDETAVYGGMDPDFGCILVSDAAPTDGPILKVVEYTTMPDGQIGCKFQCLKA